MIIGDNYGYEINKTIRLRTGGQYDFKEATLYTAFKRLEQSGLITSYWGEDGPSATLTPRPSPTRCRCRVVIPATPISKSTSSPFNSAWRFTFNPPTQT